MKFNFVYQSKIPNVEIFEEPSSKNRSPLFNNKIRKNFSLKKLQLNKRIKTKFQINLRPFMASKIVSNKNIVVNYKKLIKLGIILKEQLPNIPKNYIYNLLFDPNHESLIITYTNSGKKTILGGCCYRIFKDQQILELAFFSISRKYQRMGFGSVLMGNLKNRAKKLKVNSILTCADKNAVKFFLKQDFQIEITIPYFFWLPYFKEYDEITTMQCILVFDEVSIELGKSGLKMYENCLNLKNNNSRRKQLKLKKEPQKSSLENIIEKKNISLRLNLHRNICETGQWIKSSQEFEIIIDSLKLSDPSFLFLEPLDSMIFEKKKNLHNIHQTIDLRTIEERVRRNNYYFNPNILLSDLKKFSKFLHQNLTNYSNLRSKINNFEKTITEIEKF